MKFLISIAILIILSFCACLFFPWWSIAIVAFVISVLIPQAPLASFASGFLALFLLWGGLSFWISSNNNNILAHRVSLLILKMDNPLLLCLVTAVIGALIGGFATLTGSYLRRPGVKIRN